MRIVQNVTKKSILNTDKFSEQKVGPREDTLFWPGWVRGKGFAAGC